MVVVALLAAAPAQGRRPIVSYIDAGTLKLYDLELGADVAAPPITIPGLVPRYSMSLDGRFVIWVDASAPKKLHLFDRGSGTERSLPGIDIYTNPGGLTVSNTGLVGFDNNSNGPAVVYDSAAGAFVPTGLDALNGHRQTKLSGNGLFLATTCLTGCEVDLGSDASAYVQNLTTKTDTAFPDNLTGAANKDEEHPCTNASGSLVGIDITNPVQRDIFLYDRTAGALVPLPGLNDPVKQDTSCVTDSAGAYIGYLFDNIQFRIYERSSASLLTLPSRPFATSSTFTDPYSPAVDPPAVDLELTVSGKKKQRLGGKRPSVGVTVGCNADCNVAAKGKVIAKLPRAGGRRLTEKLPLKAAEAAIGANDPEQLKLRLSKAAAKELGLLADDGASLTAKIKVTAGGATGDLAKARFKAKLEAR